MIMTETSEPAACAGSDGVMRQTLTVAAIGDGYVWLSGRRASGCTSCAAKTGCGAGALAEIMDGEQALRLPLTMPLSVGDRVVVAMERSAFLGAAMKAYLLPPLALIGVAALSMGLGLSDWSAAVLCIPALALSLWPLSRAGRHDIARPSLWLEGLANE